MSINAHIAALLSRREINDGAIRAFLAPDYKRDTHDPFLFDDMPIAVERILKAISTRERITIYGDYDVDGVTSAVLLHDVLTKAHADVSCFFNHREDDGYGLHRRCIDTIAEQGTRLIITTDCGISNADEVAYASSSGIDVIITDHHTPPNDSAALPRCIAIIHPQVHADKYPWKYLSGGGIAFKLAQTLCRTFAETDTAWQHEEKWLLDLVALSMLADCVPLKGENRVLLHYGLKVIAKTRRPGIQQLLLRVPSFYKSSLVDALQYSVIPLLNAASRMAHASDAARALLAPDIQTADAAIEHLIQLNRARQQLVRKTIRAIPGNILVNSNVFFAASPAWRLGVLGLAANKLLAEYQKPIILMKNSVENIGVCRSTPNIHIAKTLSSLADYFSRYGGHRAAGGFALKPNVSIEEFAQALERIDFAREKTAEDSRENNKDVEHEPIEIRLSDFTAEFARDFTLCEPWGHGNPKPLYRIVNCAIRDTAPIGTRGQWIRMAVEQDGSRISLRSRTSEFPFRTDSLPLSCDIICEAGVREWRGMNELFFTAKHIIHYD